VIEASPAALVAVWERAAGLPIAERDRELLMLDAGADRDVDAWTLGRRDAAFARIFRTLYGELLEATIRCSACDALLEFETTIGALFDASADDVREPGPFCIRHDGYELTLAPLCAGNLARLPRSPAQAVESVLRRCIIAARRGDRAVDVGGLPAAVRAAVSAALRAADPRGETLIALACECGAENSVVFEMGTFLFDALDRSAAQSLADVHVLASAYGWTERDIFALPERRRRRYLELLGG
jgi:hypothetical protein